MVHCPDICLQKQVLTKPHNLRCMLQQSGWHIAAGTICMPVGRSCTKHCTWWRSRLCSCAHQSSPAGRGRGVCGGPQSLAGIFLQESAYLCDMLPYNRRCDTVSSGSAAGQSSPDCRKPAEKRRVKDKLAAGGEERQQQQVLKEQDGCKRLQREQPQADPHLTQPANQESETDQVGHS